MIGDRRDLCVAVTNGPRSTVVGGDAAAVDELVDRVSAAEVFARRVQVDVASHTPQVDPLLDELSCALATITPLRPATTFDSTVDGGVVTGADLDAGYWVRNLRQPVRFGAAVERQIAAGATAFVEISPHPVLVPAVAAATADQNRRDGQAGPVRVVGSLRRGDPGRASLLTSLAALWAGGVEAALGGGARGGGSPRRPAHLSVATPASLARPGEAVGGEGWSPAARAAHGDLGGSRHGGVAVRARGRPYGVPHRSPRAHRRHRAGLRLRGVDGDRGRRGPRRRFERHRAARPAAARTSPARRPRGRGGRRTRRARPLPLPGAG